MHPGYGMKYSHDDMELSVRRGQGRYRGQGSGESGVVSGKRCILGTE